MPTADPLPVRRAATIAFTDIAGSTAMTERLGDAAWYRVLCDHNEIVRERAAAHGGRELKFRGDGFMLAFEDPASAVAFAIDVQRAIGAYGESGPAGPLRVRIGIHHGPALEAGDELIGLAVNLAERIMSAARGGEILVSEAVEGLVRDERGRIGHARETALRGLSGRHRVFPLDWAPARADGRGLRHLIEVTRAAPVPVAQAVAG